MKFFKADDFQGCRFVTPHSTIMFQSVADIANAKLKREGQVLYGRLEFLGVNGEIKGSVFEECDKDYQTHKALLINVEPIEKCKHDTKKLTLFVVPGSGFHNPDFKYFECKCGAKLTPTGFEEIP